MQRNIAKFVGSNHTCNRQKSLWRSSQNPIRVLSTDNPEDMEILLALTHMREGVPVANHRVTSCAPAKIEEVFGGVKKIEI